MNALDYLLKANLYGLLFVGSYWLLLRRHTFFGLNRAYLLASVLLSLVLPVVSLPTYWVNTIETTPVPAQLVGVITLPTAAATPMVVADVPASAPDWFLIGSLTYGLIAVALLLRLGLRVGRLLRLIRQSPRQVFTDYVLVRPHNPVTPTFSFFRYLVLNPADADNELVIRHELVHIRQRHSADVLGLTGLRAVFWAVPALWLIDRALRQVHEFLADQTALFDKQQPDTYARFLVEYTFGVRPDALTNGFFNPSLLKQRIVMLHQRATNRWALGKYALVLPLVIGLLAMTTAREEITNVLTQDKPITVSGQVTGPDGKPLPGAHVTVVGTRKGINTNAGGTYTISASASSSLAFSFVGFETRVVPVAKRTAISVTLAETVVGSLPAMGNTATYRAVKPNPKMPARVDPTVQVINGEKYYSVEEKAVFPTGVPGLMQYVAKTLKYPAAARAKRVQGDVMVGFTVLPTGAVDKVNVVRGIGSGCDEEAVRVVRNMPKWLPAKQNGKAVSSQFTLPIRFALEPAEDKRTGQATPPASKTFTAVHDNSPNARFALYNDVKPKEFSMDSILKSGPAIRIRGRGPLGPLDGEEPLYLIDGVEIPAQQLRTKLNPNNIQSITVLKDISATATYGEKGKHGVILIKTKDSTKNPIEADSSKNSRY